VYKLLCISVDLSWYCPGILIVVKNIRISHVIFEEHVALNVKNHLGISYMRLEAFRNILKLLEKGREYFCICLDDRIRTVGYVAADFPIISINYYFYRVPYIVQILSADINRG